MRVLDLTQPMKEGIPVYPGDPLFRIRNAADHETDGYRVSALSFGSHTGTHLDAPAHFFEDGETLSQFPLQTFLANAAVVDLTPRLNDFCYGKLPPLILPELLEPFLSVFQKAESVILKTGWSGKFKDIDFYDAFPSLLPESADWISEQPIRILGLETPSLSSLADFDPDDGPIPESKRRELQIDATLFFHSDAEAHRILLGRTPPLFLLENLVCPNELPSITPEDLSRNWEKKLFQLFAFPLSIENAEASPIRAAAIFNSEPIKS